MSGRLSGRRSFGPVLLLGLASGAAAAVAGSRPWVEWDSGSESVQSAPLLAFSSSGDVGEMPLAGALALVVLATWGVVLVTRGKVRRLVAGLGTLASLGMLVTTVVGWSTAGDALREVLRESGVDRDLDHTPWFWVALVSALLSVTASVLAVRLVPHWPEMGRRYDAPGAAAVPERPDAEPEDRSSLELWKALDEGHDPTDH